MSDKKKRNVKNKKTDGVIQDTNSNQPKINPPQNIFIKEDTIQLKEKEKEKEIENTITILDTIITTNPVIQKEEEKKEKEVETKKGYKKKNVKQKPNEEDEEVVFKKRGRKPKGGKLINKQPENTTTQNNVSNVILHLKCSLNDLNEYTNEINKLLINNLDYNPSIPPEISTYDENRNNFYMIEKPDDTIENAYNKEQDHKLCSKCNNKIENDDSNDDSKVNMKDINAKLKNLKISFYKNTQNDKKSACFWCSYDFDNPACYIPKYEMDEKIYGYGSFCRPECAVAYLMKENIDDSSKFERYHLLNNIYGEIYNFNKNIKPAPNPHYLLDKFYGSLSIQEYRKLLKTEVFLLVIDKPLTRMLPELHEETDELNIFNTSGNSISKTTNGFSGYKVKKQSDKQPGPSKSSIIKESFNL